MEEEQLPVQGFIGPKPKHIIPEIDPYPQRNKTDVCCLIIGVVFTLLIIAPAFALRNNQHALQLTQPSDSHGQICGYDLPGKPFVSFISPPSLTQRACVSACPSSTKPKITLTGTLCVPKDGLLRGLLTAQDKSDDRYFFFLEFSRYYLVLVAVVAISILLAGFMQCCPGGTMHAILFLSLIVEILLAAVFYLFTTQSLPEKIVVTVILGVAFVLTLSQIVLYRKTISINRLFLKQATRFIHTQRRVVLYIPFFLLLSLAFIFLIFQLYEAALSILPPLPPIGGHIYYTPNQLGFIVTVPLLSIYFIWGLFCLKEIFHFFIATHVIHYIYEGDSKVKSSAFKLAIKLMFKHMGSIFAAAFINSFLLVPTALFDLFRNCGGAKFANPNSCSSVLDLVRSDAMSFVILTGTPYCNSCKYCEYFWFESMTTEKTQSSLRVYRIAATIFVTVLAAIAGLFYLGLTEGKIIYFNLLVGMLLSTFFIELPVSVTDTLRLLYLMEQQAYKRRDDSFKFMDSVLSKTDQKHYLRNCSEMYTNHELAYNIATVMEGHWKLKQDKKKGKKGKKQKTNDGTTKV